MQTKKLLSLFTAVTMAVSAFSAFVFPASAEETPITTTLQHTAMFRVMSRDAENQATFELDGAETYANALEKNDWVSTALMQFSVDDENVDFTKVKSATLTFTGTNVNATKSSTLSVYSTGNADYDATTLDMNSLYTVPDTFGSGAGANVAINTEGALGGLSKIVDLPDLAAGHSGVITADITDYVKGLEAGTSNISLAVSNSNRGVTIVGKGGAVESQPTLNIVLSDEVAYSATIKTNAYAKITIGENNYYADGAGNLEIENLADGTSFDYTIAKSGYTTEQGSLTVSGADASVEKYLTPTDEKILYTEDFEDIGVAEKATLFNYQNNGGNGTAGLRYYNGGMEFLSTGNGERSGQFTFSPAIDASSGAYEINFELKNLYMSQNKSGTFTSEISFVDENDNVIFGVIPTFTDGQVSTGLNVKAGTDVKTVTTDNLADKTLTVKAVINNGTVTVNVDDYEAVTLSQAEGTQNIITGMKNVNARLIFATLDNIVIASNGVVEPIETPIPEKYAVTVAETTNGTVTADKTEAAAGETITLTVTPAENYELDTLSVTAADDTDVPVTNNEFVMPAQAVTVTAAFKAVTIAPTQAPTEAPTQAPTQAPTEAPTQAPTEAPTQAPTEAPTQAPTEAPTEEPIGENEAILTLYEAPAEDTQAVVIISTYDDDGEMLSMSIDDITLSAGETRVRVDAPNGSKVMIWDSLASMTPLADPAIAGDGYVDPTPTTEPTAAPTQEPIDLTAVIDFTNRTLTYESKGNTTVFNVVSADTIAPALAAAGAGDVLQLGSNQNGASKMLGYKASFAKEGEDVVVYSGQATMSFKLELNQVRTDKDAKIELSFADINGTSILPITVGTGNSAYLTVNGVNASNIAYGNYYIVTYTMDFDAQTASVTITDASGNPCLDTGSVAIEAENITQLYRADSDWLYGYVIIDDIKLDATNIGVPKFYTITVNTERYAKLTTDAGDKYFADVNGKLEIPLQTPGTTFDYTISKVGYADVTGTVEPLTGDITIDKPMTKTDESVIFIESEFGNENEAYVSPGGNRNDSISLGEITLPDISEISVDFEFAGFGNYSGQQKTWYINTDAGELVGIQINDNGLIAWTGWTGSANHNQSEDAGTFTNSEKIGDAPNGAFTVSFVVDKVNKAITVLYNDSSYSLPYTIEAATITGLGTGLYRYNGELKTTEIKIVEPDTEFMQLSGDTSFAKVSGKTVTRSYLKSEAVITPGETFTWAVTNAEGATDANVTITQEGVLSVTDAAVPGVYTITCTGTTGKTASLDVTVQDFATVTPTVDGPKTYTVGQEGTYAVTSLVDQYGDDVFELFDAKFASDNTDVITIDETTGVATAVANGDANISITIGNPGKENTVKIPVTVDTYYITVDASGDSTVIDISSIIGKGNGTYQVTTTNSGAIVTQTTVNAPTEGTSITVGTAGADKVEVAPIYTATLNTEILVPNDRYNITVSASGRRTDVYVNDQLFINNINQGSDNWTIGRIFGETTVKSVEDVVINEGYATFNLQDNAGATVNGITFVKAPSTVARQQRIYVLGDSLVAEYYGTAPEGQEALVRTGWGQVLENYIVDSVGVTNLGNSGVTALGLRDSAFSNVVHSAQPGDIMILESGYNDKNYNTEAEMTEAVTYMVETAYAMGLKTFVVTPNASSHGTGQKPDVNWSGLMRTIAADLGEKTTLIDLARESYDFLTGLYTTDGTMNWDIVTEYYNNEKDKLHSSTNAANCWARIIAQGLYKNGFKDVVNTEYSYTFNDGIADRVIQVEAE